MKKSENLRDSSKLDPLIFSDFFSLLRKPGRLCRPDCRFIGLCATFAVLLRRNEREALRAPPSPQGEGIFIVANRKGFPLRGSCRLIRRLMRCSAPQSALSLSARFPAGKRRFPAGDTIQQWRQADHALRDRARETRKKKDLKTKDELARTFDFRSFFRIACRNKPTQDWFSGGF